MYQTAVIAFVPVLVLAIGAIAALWQPMLDIDIWWHIRTGEAIWQVGFVPTADLFSYPALGREWLNHEWGSELLSYLLYTHLGLVGILALRWLLATVSAWCVYRTGVALGANRWVSLCLTLAACQVIWLRFVDRPAVFTTAFLCVLLWLITMVRQGEYPRRAYLWLCLLFPVWANLHGGVILGFEVLCLLWVPDCVQRWRGRSVSPIWPLREEFLFPLCVVLVCLNPVGYRIFTFPFENLGLTVAIGRTQEWLSAFHPDSAQMVDAHWVPYLFVIVGLAFLLLRHGVGLPYLLILGLLGAMAMKAVRFVAEFGCVIAPIVAAMTGPLTQRWRGASLVAGAATLFLLGANVHNAIKRGGLSHQEQVLQLTEFPQFAGDLIDFLNRHAITGKVFNDINLGARFIFARGPVEKVFFDGRHSVYGNQHYLDYLGALRHPEEFEALSERYGGFDYVILGHLGWQNHVGLHRYLWSRPEWELVYFSNQGYVYVRRQPQFAELIRKFRIAEPPALLIARVPFLPDKK